jgi:hypothetical protein
MKRLTLALGALVLVLSVSAPARADYTVIRWSSGYCSVWSDDGQHLWPTWESGWTRVSHRHHTWDGAWGRMTKLWGSKACI